MANRLPNQNWLHPHALTIIGDASPEIYAETDKTLRAVGITQLHQYNLETGVVREEVDYAKGAIVHLCLTSLADNGIWVTLLSTTEHGDG